MKSKKEILRLAKLKGACIEGYTAYKNARGKENYTVLLKNIDWLVKLKILEQDDIKWLIKADIHADNDKALRAAAYMGNLELVKCLINHGADIHACNGYTLMLAADRGHYKIVEYIEQKLAEQRNEN